MVWGLWGCHLSLCSKRHVWRTGMGMGDGGLVANHDLLWATVDRWSLSCADVSRMTMRDPVKNASTMAFLKQTRRSVTEQIDKFIIFGQRLWELERLCLLQLQEIMQQRSSWRCSNWVSTRRIVPRCNTTTTLELLALTYHGQGGTLSAQRNCWMDVAVTNRVRKLDGKKTNNEHKFGGTWTFHLFDGIEKKGEKPFRFKNRMPWNSFENRTQRVSVEVACVTIHHTLPMYTLHSTLCPIHWKLK